MIKFTIILIIVYFVLMFFTSVYVASLSELNKIRFSLKHYSACELIWLCLLGLMRVACIILGAISAIMLVVKCL